MGLNVFSQRTLFSQVPVLTGKKKKSLYSSVLLQSHTGGLLFWVQRGVNGSEQLLHIVLIAIKSLQGAELLFFVHLGRRFHMLWTMTAQLLGHVPTA